MCERVCTSSSLLRGRQPLHGAAREERLRSLKRTPDPVSMFEAGPWSHPNTGARHHGGVPACCTGTGVRGGTMNLDNVDLATTLALIVHRLVDAATAAINLANMFALMGAIFFVATLLMRTIVPLRIAALISNVFFIAYGVLANSINAFILYCLLLPINSVRLYQMIKLIRKADRKSVV